MTAQLAVGVIGHVDHGKTSLVKALSGMETDRLKEEKERGMSIVLGFAYLTFDEGVIDLIDVPGHENFIRTMVSGATGIRAALLVIDANEGIKPQTLEHLAIIDLLGIRRGIIAITKSDLADTETRTALLSRLRKQLAGSALEFAPRIFTSTLTGEGISELQLALKGLLAEPSPLSASSQFWLPVDRVFSVAGHGTVVTGTLRLGSLAVGDEVEIMPAGRRASVRQIEMHGKMIERVCPGQRAGINLRPVKLQDIQRGDALAPVGLLQASTLIDAQVTLLASQKRALCTAQPLRLLFGTTDVLAYPRILSSDRLEPGQSAIVQFRTQRPVAALAGEPFILRSDSPALTIGGGRFLDPVPKRHRRTQTTALQRLQVLAGGSGDAILIEQVKAAGYEGISLTGLASRTGKPETELLEAASLIDLVTFIDGSLLYQPHVATLECALLEALASYHQQHPTRLGAPMSYCRASLPGEMGEKLFKALLQALTGKQKIEIRLGLVCEYGYHPLQCLSQQDRLLAESIESAFRLGGTTPPDITDVLNGNNQRENIFYMLVETGRLILLKGDQPGKKIAFHSDTIRELDQRLSACFAPPAQFTVSQARELAGSTRKFMVPLLEYFDIVGYTRRQGDKRIIVKAAGQTETEPRETSRKETGQRV